MVFFTLVGLAVRGRWRMSLAFTAYRAAALEAALLVSVYKRLETFGIQRKRISKAGRSPVPASS